MNESPAKAAAPRTRHQQRTHDAAIDATPTKLAIAPDRMTPLRSDLAHLGSIYKCSPKTSAPSSATAAAASAPPRASAALSTHASAARDVVPMMGSPLSATLRAAAAAAAAAASVSTQAVHLQTKYILLRYFHSEYLLHSAEYFCLAVYIIFFFSLAHY